MLSKFEQSGTSGADELETTAHLRLRQQPRLGASQRGVSQQALERGWRCCSPLADVRVPDHLQTHRLDLGRCCCRVISVAPRGAVARSLSTARNHLIASDGVIPLRGTRSPGAQPPRRSLSVARPPAARYRIGDRAIGPSQQLAGSGLLVLRRQCDRPPRAARERESDSAERGGRTLQIGRIRARWRSWGSLAGRTGLDRQQAVGDLRIFGWRLLERAEPASTKRRPRLHLRLSGSLAAAREQVAAYAQMRQRRPRLPVLDRSTTLRFGRGLLHSFQLGSLRTRSPQTKV